MAENRARLNHAGDGAICTRQEESRMRGGFHHVDLNVSDLAAAKAVYGPVLTFLGYRQVHDDAQRCEWALGPDGHGASLGLRQSEAALAGHAHERYAPGLHHLAWRAASRADVA